MKGAQARGHWRELAHSRVGTVAVSDPPMTSSLPLPLENLIAASKKIVPKSAYIIVRGLREDFAKFFDDPSRAGFCEMIRNHGGELRELDFKAAWPDTPALAKHVLAIANSAGGCLVIGATEDAQRIVHPTGLPKVADKAVIASGLRRYVPDVLAAGVTIQDFSYNSSDYDALNGKCF